MDDLAVMRRRKRLEGVKGAQVLELPALWQMHRLSSRRNLNLMVRQYSIV